MRSRVVNMTIPTDLIEQIDAAAAAEGRTRSELVREAARRYIKERRPRRKSGSRLLSRLAALVSDGPRVAASDLDGILYARRRRK